MMLAEELADRARFVFTGGPLHCYKKITVEMSGLCSCLPNTHDFDGRLASSLTKSEANTVVANYVHSLRHFMHAVPKPGTRFMLLAAIPDTDRIDTRNMQWRVIADKSDPFFELVPPHRKSEWDRYDPQTQMLVAVFIMTSAHPEGSVYGQATVTRAGFEDCHRPIISLVSNCVACGAQCCTLRCSTCEMVFYCFCGAPTRTLERCSQERVCFIASGAQWCEWASTGPIKT